MFENATIKSTPHLQLSINDIFRFQIIKNEFSKYKTIFEAILGRVRQWNDIHFTNDVQ